MNPTTSRDKFRVLVVMVMMVVVATASRITSALNLLHCSALLVHAQWGGGRCTLIMECESSHGLSPVSTSGRAEQHHVSEKREREREGEWGEIERKRDFGAHFGLTEADHNHHPTLPQQRPQIIHHDAHSRAAIGTGKQSVGHRLQFEVMI